MAVSFNPIFRLTPAVGDTSVRETCGALRPLWRCLRILWAVFVLSAQTADLTPPLRRLTSTRSRQRTGKIEGSPWGSTSSVTARLIFTVIAIPHAVIWWRVAV